MARVFVPPALRSATGGLDQVEAADVATIGAAIDQLDLRYPGFRAALCAGDRLRPGLAASVDGAVATLGLRQPLPPDAELHFHPALGGG